MSLRRIFQKKDQKTKVSLFQKIIDFLIWGGLIVTIVHLQKRYHQHTVISVPVSLVSGEIASQPNTLKLVQACQNSPENRISLSLNEFDSLFLIPRNTEIESQESFKNQERYTVHLNHIDSNSLVALPGIGPFTARKIIQYRNRLGGYYSKYQLLEIKHIDSQLVESERLEWLIDTGKIDKISLNNLEISRWYQHPYIGKQKAKLLQEYLRVHKQINRHQFESLRSLTSQEKKILMLYLKFN